MAVLKNTRLAGSTLLEVVVASAIIMMIFGISMMIYLNLLNSSFSRRQLRTDLLLKEVSEETMTIKSYFDESIERNGMVITKTVTKYRSIKTLIHLHLETQDAVTKKPITRDQLIHIDDEEN